MAPATAQAPLSPAELKVLAILRYAMIAAVLFYALVGLILGTSLEPRMPGDLLHWLVIFLSVMAGIHVLTVVLLRQLIAGLTGGSYKIYCILRWALAETVAIYGLVLHILGAGWTVFGVFLILSLGLLWIMPSSEADHRSYADLAE